MQKAVQSSHSSVKFNQHPESFQLQTIFQALYPPAFSTSSGWMKQRCKLQSLLWAASAVMKQSGNWYFTGQNRCSLFENLTIKKPTLTRGQHEQLKTIHGDGRNRKKSTSISPWFYDEEGTNRHHSTAQLMTKFDSLPFVDSFLSKKIVLPTPTYKITKLTKQKARVHYIEIAPHQPTSKNNTQ